MREYFVQRSVHRLKIDDAGAWATYAMTPAEFDRSVSGAPERTPSCRFADVLTAAGLDASYLHYLGEVTPEALALVNMMSMFGLHRNLRGAATGQVVATKITIRRSSAGLVDALLRLGAPQPCVQFYRDHAGSPRRATVDGLLEREPELEPDVVLGIRAFEVLEERFASRLLTCWADGGSSLRHLSLR
jgi:hypothetical protein